MDIAFIDPEGYDGRQKGDYMGWVTPFDIRSEMRLSDDSEFKKHVKHLYYDFGEEDAVKYIRENKHRYTRLREVSHVSELSDKYCSVEC